MNVKDVFSERLENLRIEQGITRQKVADDLQISRASLEYYEKGKRVPDIVTLCAIAEYYNVSADYLLGRTTNKTTDTDLQAVCDYTGLSEKAINNIIHKCRNKLVNGIMSELDFVNIFLSDYEIIREASRATIKYTEALFKNCKAIVEHENLPDEMQIEKVDELFKLADEIQFEKWRAAKTFEWCLQTIVSDYKDMKEGVSNAQHNQKQE